MVLSGLFFAYNILYLVPIILVYYGILGDDAFENFVYYNYRGVLLSIVFVYLIGIVSFCAGDLFALMLKMNSPKYAYVRSKDMLRQKLVTLDEGLFGFLFRCFALLAMLGHLIMKYLLIGEGVYHEYAFDSGKMATHTWNISAFFSELLIILFVYFYSIYKCKRTVKNLLIVSTMVLAESINLLHGTRIFILVMILTMLIIDGMIDRIKWKKIGFLIVLSTVLFYAVYIYRSNISIDMNEISISHFIKPILYESVFSQLSLANIMRYNLIGYGSIVELAQKIMLKLIPRPLLPEKDDVISSLSIYSDIDLSPLGAFSGYGQLLIYCGWFYFVVLFMLGFIGGLLKRYSSHPFFFLTFVYYSGNFMFRFMRDGIVIPIKILTNFLAILLVFMVIYEIIIIKNKNKFAPKERDAL